ncbi:MULTISPECIES: hypothetical protein [Streptomyces]|uniref:hypothetical protein n=1 Tax=Streptomyces TaxID=1883 RepID=UPI001E2CF4D3|nr:MULTISPECIES: hypothetical protein [Streptomyces]UFQ19892.1 hypothetical protein J2N69_35770 [Streptomyces huasconensis]WCL89515.1 hypothetical protein PPN52_35715 [Streptomyces sp. JCM 35825]
MRAVHHLRAAAVTATAVLTLFATGSTSQAGPQTAGAPSAAVAAPRATLKCTLRTGPGQRITFSPAVTSTPRKISARGSANLNNCTSPNGRQSGIRSGRITLKGSAHASCSRARSLKGTATATWYSGPHRTGRVLGHSTFRPAPHGTRGYTAADSFLNGTVASGRMAHRSFSGTAVPTNNVRHCFSRGLGYIEGRGNLTIR